MEYEDNKIRYYEEIKNELINNEANKRVKDYSKNKSDLDTYYNVGKLLIEAQGGEDRAKYGNYLIKEYSRKLTIEFGSGYSTRSLKYMRKFYLFQKGQPVVAQMSWSHYCILLSINDDNKINYYINQIMDRNLSKRQLQDIIKNKEYERLPDKTKIKLINKEKNKIEDYIKNPIIIHNPGNIEVVKEKVLQKLILEDMDNFLKELGTGFSYIANQYKIKIGNSYNYIDILLYNYVYNAFVVVELKVTELRKEYIGQLEVYMNYIDNNLKTINQNKTIGIIVTKKNNKYIMEYSSDPRILSKEYILV